MEEYNVAADIKIFLENASNEKSVRAGIEKLAKIRSSSMEDGPFGIKILRATLLLNDEQGAWTRLRRR